MYESWRFSIVTLATHQSAVVVVIDRLNAPFLGPYGNTSIETPMLNEMAAGALLVEQAITNSLDLDAVYRAYFGIRQAPGSSRIATGGLLPRLPKGVKTVLLTDDATMMDRDYVAAFSDGITVKVAQALQAAEAVEQTRLAGIMAEALSCLHSLDGSFLLWVHISALNVAWDAPRRQRVQLAGEDDPDPPVFVLPPHEKLIDEPDPDYLLGLAQAYGAEVVTLDTCLEPVWHCLQTEERFRDTLFIFTAPRGYPLGEHGIVGDAAPCLYSESLQVPLLARFPGGAFQAERMPTLVQPPDVCASLAQHFQLEPGGRGINLPELTLNPRDREAVSCSNGKYSIRTPAWFLTGSVSEDTPRVAPDQVPAQLFLKPDDRWEVNDLIDRCPDIASQLQQRIEDFQAALAEDCLPQLPPLAAELCQPPA